MICRASPASLSHSPGAAGNDGRCVVALGGGGFNMGPDNPRLDRYVLALARNTPPKICFVPTASGDADNYIVRFYDAFTVDRCLPSHLRLFSRKVQDLREFVLEQDIVYVGGGATAYGSSGIFGNPRKRGHDLQEEVAIVSIPIAHALEDLDLVVDALEQAGVERVATVGEDAGQPLLELAGESLQGFNAATDGTLVPCGEEAGSRAGVEIVPHVLEVVLQHIDGGQPAVGGQ